MNNPVRNHPSRKFVTVPANKPGEVQDRPKSDESDVEAADPKATEHEPPPA
jgi:hypothetical protein